MVGVTQQKGWYKMDYELRYEYPITVEFGRLVAVAQMIGSQDSNFCPPHTENCWRHRNLTSYLPVDPDDPNATECTECFLHYLLTGE